MSFKEAPFRDAEFMAVDLSIDERPDGSIIFESVIPMPDYDKNFVRTILSTVETNKEAIALAERNAAGDWVKVSYGDLKKRIFSMTQWMLENIPRGRALMVLSENSIDTAIVNFACYCAGVIHTPISPSFALPGDYARFKHVANLTTPAGIFSASHKNFATSIENVLSEDVKIITANDEFFHRPTAMLKDIYALEADEKVNIALDAIDPEAVSTYMMTSGSTGLPKVVTLSLAALAANSAQTYAAVGRAAGWDDEMVDWLPWHHAAGLSVLRSSMVCGGSLYIDAGKPIPTLIDETIKNLTEIPVCYFNNVPSGYAMLVNAMEQNAEFKKSFFKKMRLMLFGGAGLAQSVYDRLQEMAYEETGHRIHMTTGYGMTETVSGCMTIHYPTQKVGIGLPCPGVTVKLLPVEDRYEIRLKGPNLMNGYLNNPEKNAEAFDGEGFYKTGDLVRLINPDDLSEGLAFSGRLAEEFKLLNGSWVYGGELRSNLLKALAEDVAELVICDANRPYLTLMVWPKAGASEERISASLVTFNTQIGGASTTIKRFTMLTTPPDMSAHEVSDKGTINRRAVLSNRQDILEALYEDSPPPTVHIVT
ncbi:feruloyl-CoA synthase [Litorimonas taeanensis]|uniref:Feruloyl-CoA synthase n=1 Tax=Litorimonas taeanensis TaxID=568099 RepID=A0A420WMN9_9PROT|nr:AMP-binding protein [Litorimonas taeanensis]RKQ72182.1 feruloyl-CoA synthase [Litorimonas taeanensis]